MVKKNNSKYCLVDFKKAQAMSTETYIAILIFLSVIVLFYSLFAFTDIDQTRSKNIIFTVEKIKSDLVFDKGFLDNDDLEFLLPLDCSDLKDYFQVRNDFCIFLVDSNDKIIPFRNITHYKYGIGCKDVSFNNGTTKFECGKIREIE
ncbi:MAG: hypothetical protein ACLFPJ_00490 [Candidatus Woesearchaeota archaeon]